MTLLTLARPEGKFELLGADPFEGDEERAGVAPGRRGDQRPKFATLRGQTAPVCGRGAPAATTIPPAYRRRDGAPLGAM
jgi:hypothetical protein